MLVNFISLTDNTEVQYKVKGMRNVNFERSIKWDDPDLDINWPISEENINQILLSKKDLFAPNFLEVVESGDIFN